MSPAFFGAASMLSIVSQTDPTPYSGCHEIQLDNCIGKEVKVGTNANDSHQSVNAYIAVAISISNHTSQSPLSFFVPGYNPIHGIVISPYQSIMLPLNRQRKRTGMKRRKTSVSGFRYYI